jgi:hypothetical protein
LQVDKSAVETRCKQLWDVQDAAMQHHACITDTYNA